MCTKTNIFLTKLLSVLSFLCFFVAIILSILHKYLRFLAEYNNTNEFRGSTILMNPSSIVPSFTTEIVALLIISILLFLCDILLIKQNKEK